MTHALELDRIKMLDFLIPNNDLVNNGLLVCFLFVRTLFQFSVYLIQSRPGQSLQSGNFMEIRKTANRSLSVSFIFVDIVSIFKLKC